MELITAKKEQEAKKYMKIAIEVAKKATCTRSKCGCVIVKNGKVIGTGFNSPPKNDNLRCTIKKETYHQKVTDKTCCMHAETRAIIDALKHNPQNVNGSSLFFIRLNQNNKKMFAGKPYCTICSKLALDTGIKYFVLWHKEGITEYKTSEYNDLSYSYDEQV